MCANPTQWYKVQKMQSCTAQTQQINNRVSHKRGLAQMPSIL